MQKKKYCILSLLNLSLIISTSVFTQANVNDNDQLNQATQELEGCMNEEFDNLSASRAGNIDKDYDAICDQTPLKALPKWQQWLNSIGGTIMLRTVLFKRFIAARYTALKSTMSVWWYGKPKTILNSNGCDHGPK